MTIHREQQGVKDIVKDVPQEYLERMILDYYTTNVKISEHRSLDIEWITRGQGTPDNISSNIWLAERRKRSTSSNTGALLDQGVQQRLLMWSNWYFTAHSGEYNIQSPIQLMLNFSF